ncbi:Hsp20/alpha crystallin family protein [Patescibacteria group bacterium]|nr:Hsp20/alpha crystallin family protein [Patescibacteria group bacterium]MBU1703026.1 Hsp20/alpha crystallin family protein [Patescibacteria group bacterium]MBU1953926.1 Hsp20/alpha crystallin family protein [Patescibacteria group bacterium]
MDTTNKTSRGFTKKPISGAVTKSGAAGSSAKGPASTGEEKPEGQLALDVYQTKTHIVIVAPIAGVKLSDINVSVTEDVLLIKGKRSLDFAVPDEDYFTQECFWGDFSRSIVLPAAVDASKISASFKDAVLKISIPKTERTKTKIVRINEE